MDVSKGHRGVHRYVFLYFHSVSWQTVDVGVTLLIAPSPSLHHPGLQHHLLYFSCSDRKKLSQQLYYSSFVISKNVRY